MTDLLICFKHDLNKGLATSPEEPVQGGCGRGVVCTSTLFVVSSQVWSSYSSLIIIIIIMTSYAPRSSSVARQNQRVKQLRKRRTVRESLMDGRRF